jgi:Cu/Zn superoxide dismutase
MDDPMFEHTKKSFLQLKEQIKMLKKENTMLRNLLNDKESKVKTIPSLRTIEEYNPLDFCKEFQKLYKKEYNVGFHIHNFGSSTASMRKVIDAFQQDNESNNAVLEFLTWAVKRKTHTGHFMNIGYLSTLIQTYRTERLTKNTVEPKVSVDNIDKERLAQIIAKRSK